MSFFNIEDLLGGGFSGGRHHHHQEESDEEETNNNEYYEILQVDKKATTDEIKKSYRKLARKLHPDKHPDAKDEYQKKFQDLQKAWECLKDPHKRDLYDKYGEKGLKQGGGHTFKGGMGGLFEEIFGGGGRRSQQNQGPKKSPSIQRILTITLEDSYSGSLKTIKVGKQIAKGNAKSAKCMKCNGHGKITITQQRGPMVFQSTQGCNACNGMGYKLARKDVDIDVNVPIGAKDGETFTINGLGHEYPDHEPGDIVIKFRMSKHPVFTRQGADLGMTHKISLREALCGYKIRVKHVSGKNLVITPENSEEIVQSGSLKRVMNMGMPKRFAPHVSGHLYIVIDVEFPEKLDNKTVKLFKKILPNNLDKENENKFGSDDDSEMKNNNYDKKKKTKPNSNFGQNLFNNFNKKSGNKKMNNSMDEDDSDVEEVEAQPCEDNPKATPASAQHEYDDDDAQEGVQCKQM